MKHQHDFATTREPQRERKTQVKLDGRTFYVGKREDGTAVNIMERKRRKNGLVSQSTYWHHSHRLPGPGREGRGQSIVRTVLEMAGVDTLQIAGH